jgi:hypothetical protein
VLENYPQIGEVIVLDLADSIHGPQGMAPLTVDARTTVASSLSLLITSVSIATVFARRASAINSGELKGRFSGRNLATLTWRIEFAYLKSSATRFG